MKNRDKEKGKDENGGQRIYSKNTAYHFHYHKFVLIMNIKHDKDILIQNS